MLIGTMEEEEMASVTEEQANGGKSEVGSS